MQGAGKIMFVSKGRLHSKVSVLDPKSAAPLRDAAVFLK
jgi:hypothetical protein